MRKDKIYLRGLLFATGEYGVPYISISESAYGVFSVPEITERVLKIVRKFKSTIVKLLKGMISLDKVRGSELSSAMYPYHFMWDGEHPLEKGYFHWHFKVTREQVKRYNKSEMLGISMSDEGIRLNRRRVEPEGSIPKLDSYSDLEIYQIKETEINTWFAVQNPTPANDYGVRITVEKGVEKFDITSTIKNKWNKLKLMRFFRFKKGSPF